MSGDNPGTNITLAGDCPSVPWSLVVRSLVRPGLLRGCPPLRPAVAGPAVGYADNPEHRKDGG